MVKISAIICTYNREKYLPGAIEALLLQKNISVSDFEIVIINNNSTDRTEEIVNDYLQKNSSYRFTYSVETKQGLSHARNKGIEVSKGKLLAFLDDDAYAHKNYIHDVLDFFDHNPLIQAVGGKILLHFEQKEPLWYTPYLGSLLGYFNPWNKPRFFNKKQYPRGSNMVYKKELFNKYGVFNPALGRIGSGMLGSEEKEMFQRIYSGNEKIYYLPEAVIYHMVPIERTTIPFIKNQSMAVGRSEHIRIQTTNKGLAKKIMEEIIKWGISKILCIYYIITLRPLKGLMLLRFRYWVFLGLKGKN
jgi:glucosyl-dolichyl phosphate glucuronosyltransferase